jgi:hypothetical protein
MARANYTLPTWDEDEFVPWPMVSEPPLVDAEALPLDDVEGAPYADPLFDRRLKDYFARNQTTPGATQLEDAREGDARSRLFRALETGTKQAIGGITQTAPLAPVMEARNDAPRFEAKMAAQQKDSADRAFKERSLLSTQAAKEAAAKLDADQFEKGLGVKTLMAQTARSMDLQNMGLREQAKKEEEERLARAEEYRKLSGDRQFSLEEKRLEQSQQNYEKDSAFKQQLAEKEFERKKALDEAEQARKNKLGDAGAEARAAETKRKAEKGVAEAKLRLGEAKRKEDRDEAKKVLEEAKFELDRVIAEEKIRASIVKSAPVGKGKGKAPAAGGAAKEKLAEERVALQRERMARGLAELEVKDLEGNRHRARTRAEAEKGRNIMAGSQTMLDLLGPIRADIARFGSANWPTERKAKLQGELTNLWLVAKGPALYELGVVAGPDMMLLERAVGDPSGLESFISGGSQTLARLGAMERTIRLKAQNFVRSQDGALPPEAPETPAATGGAGALTPKQKQALEWLKANPKHPSAEKVRARLVAEGVKL